jgi:RHS repeat-associated protein
MNGNIEYFDYGFENNTNNNFVMYLGQYKDQVTGLYYNYNRDYSHKLKRYLQIDPLKLYDGSNPYIYVSNNHVNYYDIFGLCACLGNYGSKIIKRAYKEMERGKKWSLESTLPKHVNSIRYLKKNELLSGVLGDISSMELWENSFKCNAFVDYLYRSEKLQMPSFLYRALSAKEINEESFDFFMFFEETSRAEAKAGDIVSTKSHVGLVVSSEKNLSISASPKGVREADLDYYDNHGGKYYRYKCNCGGFFD